MREVLSGRGPVPRSRALKALRFLDDSLMLSVSLILKQFRYKTGYKKKKYPSLSNNWGGGGEERLLRPRLDLPLVHIGLKLVVKM